MSKKRKAQFTRKHIISVASIMFLEKGYYATSIRDIIQTAEISKGAFYHHFASKLDLYKTIINDFLDVDDWMISEDEIDNLTLEESLKFVISKYYEYYNSLTEQTGRTLIHFQRLYFEAMLILPEVLEKIRNKYKKFIGLFVEKAMKQYNIAHYQAVYLVKRYLFQYEGAFDWLSIFPETPLDEILRSITPDAFED